MWLSVSRINTASVIEAAVVCIDTVITSSLIQEATQHMKANDGSSRPPS